MITLKLVPIDDFKQRKARHERGLKSGIDKEFESLIIDLNELSFLYTCESCYGKFDYKHRLRPNSKPPILYTRAYLRFRLECTDQAREFLTKVVEISNNSQGNTHLLDDAPLNFMSNRKKRYKENEFYFGMLPPQTKGITARQIEACYFKDIKVAREFEKVRDNLWEQWRNLVASFSQK
jgi:hypothetical protein